MKSWYSPGELGLYLLKRWKLIKKQHDSTSDRTCTVDADASWTNQDSVGTAFFHLCNLRDHHARAGRWRCSCGTSKDTERIVIFPDKGRGSQTKDHSVAMTRMQSDFGAHLHGLRISCLQCIRACIYTWDYVHSLLITVDVSRPMRCAFATFLCAYNQQICSRPTPHHHRRPLPPHLRHPRGIRHHRLLSVHLSAILTRR